MRRLSCLVLLAGIAVIASGQDLSAKITYSSPAARADKELAEIGNLAKVNLMTSPDMAQEILLVKVKDLPLSTLMAKVATATSGSWIQENTGYRLVTDPVVRRQENVSSRLARMKKLDEQIKKLVEPIEKTPHPAAAAGNSQVSGTVTVGTAGSGLTMSDGSPTGHALVRLLKIIGPGPLADLQGGDRVVWASNANRSQLPLPAGSDGPIQILVSEQNAQAAAAAKVKKTADTGTADEQDAAKQIQQMLGIDPDAQSRRLDGPPAKVLLIASRENLLGTLTLNLVLYDTNGKVLLSSRQALNVGGGLLNMDDLAALPEKLTKPVKPDADKEITLSPLSKEMLNLRSTNGLNPGTLDAKIPDDLRKIMLKPDERDPLSFAESEATMAYADGKNEGVVAELPDALLQFSLGGSIKLTSKTFEDRLKKSATVTDADGVLMIKPTDPFGNRETRVDRVALSQFIRTNAGKEFATLDSLATYALKNPEPTITPAAMTYFLIFAQDALQSGVGGRADWNMLRLYATIPDSARSALARGEQMPLGNLTPQQEGFVSRLLFGATAHLQVEDSNAAKNSTPNFLLDAISMFKMPSDYKSEPTEVMPNGFPRTGFLTLNSSTEPVAKSTSQGLMGMSALGLDELAMMKFFKESPQFAQMQGFMPNLEQLRIGQRSIYKFKFHVSQDVSESETLMDNTMAADAATVALSSLPADMQKMLDERVAQFKKLPFFGPGMLGGRGGTPP